MAEVRLTPQDLTRAGSGLAPTLKSDMSASDTYLVANDGRTVLYFENTGESSSVVTIVTPTTVDGNAVADKTVTVPATTGKRFVGPFPPHLYNVGNELTFTLTNADDVSNAVYRMPLA